MKTKTPICKSTNKKTKGFGCGNILFKKATFGGLCPKCAYKWSLETDDGKEWFKRQTAYKTKKNDKVKRAEFRQKKRELNVGNVMKLADTYFSRYIRLKHSDFGKCTCYTCGIIKDIKEVDNGHYIKREHKNTRYHENNCRPQCKTCNGDVKHNGKQAEFRVNLVNEIGEKEVSDIELLSKQKISASYLFFKDVSDHYRVKLNELQKKLKVKYW